MPSHFYHLPVIHGYGEYSIYGAVWESHTISPLVTAGSDQSWLPAWQ